MHDFFRPGRSQAMARDAMIATSHPLATTAGLEILAAGGNAVDAAIAACAVQCVVEPAMTGIGGDCFVLYAPAEGPVRALNGSGRSPAAASAAALRDQGLTEVPRISPHAVSVPGAIGAWTKLHREHGRLPFGRLLERAIDYAATGYPVTERVAQDWAREAPLLAEQPGSRAIFLPDGEAPKAGTRHRQPLLAERLTEIAAGGAEAFYQGETAQRLVAFLKSLGGLHELEDFAAATDGADWVEPISLNYRGVEVLECPPNGQGLAALMILSILQGFDLGPDLPFADRVHLHAEATKLAYHHRDALLCDPAFAAVPVAELLSEATAAILRGRIDRIRARPPVLWDEPEHRDTVYLCAVDNEGNAVSFINSLFHGFGSTLTDPATGILLHSRATSFRLIEGHPNVLAPRKRPLHTIIPGMLRRDGRALGPFGVMGGHYQSAGHAWFVSNLLDRGLDPQAALAEPRTFAFGGKLEVEPTLDEAVLAELARRGHEISLRPTPLGGGQAILIDRAAGVLHGASDHRKDGCALGF
ncbi:gamma-glutamyltranspeptidase / glutathione hydrolase [Tistlia consotensis]|uniref:Gamma-glutamyltransferase 2. Threonine peptidase. MEROPS family T03 n=1 Tax=Tistlia consotensis USBA 355 TaxID=560819 RepID=A0A1Y6BG89_9PROT|nr:gamma-glutamyltransferase family protein [Tistlia consotensis]SMF09595.1 gamma-glutamyltransferase 2. Threonine peptidase. MEROPS family T03 [Tistlia consotensis USBA 355]SNR34390.1 gamma-glutamyltranspeptidase / glutathione hydrolase [Tistlia consotensis]